MTLYGYCVRGAGEPRPPPGLAGVEGWPVHVLEEGPLALWISEGEPGPATEERLRAHDRVVRAALRTTTPLPLRYGSGRLSDEQEARELLRAEQARFREALARVADRVEMGVRIGWDPPPPPPHPTATPGVGGAGRAYLEARRRQLQSDAAARAAAELVLERAEALLAELRLPTVRSLLPERGTAGILAHLVHRSGITRYQQQVEQARRSMPEHSLIVTGPWAPYSFV